MFRWWNFFIQQPWFEWNQVKVGVDLISFLYSNWRSGEARSTRVIVLWNADNVSQYMFAMTNFIQFLGQMHKFNLTLTMTKAHDPIASPSYWIMQKMILPLVKSQQINMRCNCQHRRTVLFRFDYQKMRIYFRMFWWKQFDAMRNCVITFELMGALQQTDLVTLSIYSVTVSGRDRWRWWNEQECKFHVLPQTIAEGDFFAGISRWRLPISSQWYSLILSTQYFPCLHSVVWICTNCLLKLPTGFSTTRTDCCYAPNVNYSISSSTPNQYELKP